MSYVENNLMPNEKVIYKARLTLAIFIPTIFLLIIAIAMGAFPNLISSGQYPNVAVGIQAGCLCPAALFFLFSIINGLQALTLILTTEFAVTNQRVIAKKGFIRRHTIEILLLQVESIGVNQNILGRLLNFGKVTVTGTGGTNESFPAIIDPITVRKNVNQVIQYYSARTPMPPQTAIPSLLTN